MKELGLYVKVNTLNILEYAFVDIAQSNKDYNSHLIWHDSTNWYVAHEIYVFQIPNKFEWCYFSAEQIFSVEEARTKLKRLKFNYTEALKRYNKINAYLNFPRTSMTKSNKLRTQIIE